MTESPSPKPFKSNSDFLQTYYEILRLRCARIDLRRQLREDETVVHVRHRRRVGRSQQTVTQELRRRLRQVTAEEKKKQAEIDARLQAHRSDENAPELGIERIEDLAEKERMVLLILSIPTISGNMAEEVIGSVSRWRSSLSVDNLIDILDPENVEERISIRTIFPRLIERELITLSHHFRESSPEDSLSAGVSLTWEVCSTITGIQAPDQEEPDEGLETAQDAI